LVPWRRVRRPTIAVSRRSRAAPSGWHRQRFALEVAVRAPRQAIR
jgi:hypothetical protein